MFLSTLENGDYLRIVEAFEEPVYGQVTVASS